jgi:hypothetical protein
MTYDESLLATQIYFSATMNEINECVCFALYSGFLIIRKQSQRCPCQLTLGRCGAHRVVNAGPTSGTRRTCSAKVN